MSIQGLGSNLAGSGNQRVAEQQQRNAVANMGSGLGQGGKPLGLESNLDGRGRVLSTQG